MPRSAIGWYAAALVMLIAPTAPAFDGASLRIGTIGAQGWLLENVTVSLSGLTGNKQTLVLTADRLSFPKPFDDLEFADVRCLDLDWREGQLRCRRGKAKIRSKRWRSPQADFSFLIADNRVRLQVTRLRLFGAMIDASGEAKNNRWQFRVNAKSLDLRQIQHELRQEGVELSQGRADVEFSAGGESMQAEMFEMAAAIKGLTAQTGDGRFASEGLSLLLQLKARYDGGAWRWQNACTLNKGAVYAEPVYLETGAQPLALDAEGEWEAGGARFKLDQFHYRHDGTAEVNGSAVVSLKDGVNVESAELSLHSGDLESVSKHYLTPFFEQTVLQGVVLGGGLDADLSVVQHSLTALALSFDRLTVRDAENRFGLAGGAGSVFWSDAEALARPSRLSWRQLKLRRLPVGPGQLQFLAGPNTIVLLDKVDLPFLGGTFAVNKFTWRKEAEQEPEVYFEGAVNDVSLAQLSEALNWTPLSGTLGGTIPGVEYRNKTLKLGGELTIDVFDGTVRITELTSSGLFTDYPKLTAEIEMDNLDMEQLTSKFEFGSITGRLSGFVRQLVLENWKPVGFYAWFGTPEHDDSRHRISQKAVKNIASIGGGGATDLLSRSFLSFFETFGYDRLGIGCYLHDGVCQMMGVEATDSGYYIIKGGGLPRIDVIGFNTRLDWDVLMERLKRVMSSDEVIVQ